MVTLHYMDKNVVVINSAEAAIELLEKRAASTSGRQREVMMGEVLVEHVPITLNFVFLINLSTRFFLLFPNHLFLFQMKLCAY